MRNNNFLRTPIRADHQNRMLNLVVTEQSLEGNPAVKNPYPQTMLISFDLDVATIEVQIAMPWEGSFYFLPDDTSHLPSVIGDVTQANFPGWSLGGDLVLHTADLFSAHSQAFATHIPLILPPPNAVRYSKVKITQDFLFTTLSKLAQVNFIFDGKRVDRRDPQWLAKLIIKFVHGRAAIPCTLDANDPIKDFTMNPMPSVLLAPVGMKTTLHVTMAERAVIVAEVMDSHWFAQRPEYDNISGEQLVDSAIDDYVNQVFNPVHPGHSVLPARAVYQNAAAMSYAPDHAADAPLRVALSEPRTDGTTYRRLDVIRPPIPGETTTSYTQRPYPMYQLACKPVGGGAHTALRIPLNGRVYLPLDNEDYVFWAIPRSQDPAVVPAGDQMRLSVQTPPHRFIDLPATTLTVAFAAADTTKTIYAHLLPYDSARVWTALVDLGNRFTKLKAAAEAHWNVDVLNLFIYRSATMSDYAPIYGYIRASAGRHGLAPEFLHAVFMGEGVGASDNPTTPQNEDGLIERNRKHVPRIVYVPAQVIDGWVDLGLDDIQTTIKQLIADNYLDGSFASVLTRLRNELNELRETKPTADVIGWEAAIELIAAELHSRLDQMLTFCAANSVAISTEEQRRYLAYIRYNTGVATSQEHARHLNERLKRWEGTTRPTDRMNGRYNTLQRIAITEWYEASKVYR